MIAEELDELYGKIYDLLRRVELAVFGYREDEYDSFHYNADSEIKDLQSLCSKFIKKLYQHSHDINESHIRLVNAISLKFDKILNSKSPHACYCEGNYDPSTCCIDLNLRDLKMLNENFALKSNETIDFYNELNLKSVDLNTRKGANKLLSTKIKPEEYLYDLFIDQKSMNLITYLAKELTQGKGKINYLGYLIWWAFYNKIAIKRPDFSKKYRSFLRSKNLILDGEMKKVENKIFGTWNSVFIILIKTAVKQLSEEKNSIYKYEDYKFCSLEEVTDAIKNSFA